MMFGYFVVIEGRPISAAHAAFMTSGDAHKWAEDNSSNTTKYVVLEALGTVVFN
jgi:hypothetical protein